MYQDPETTIFFYFIPLVFLPYLLLSFSNLSFVPIILHSFGLIAVLFLYFLTLFLHMGDAVAQSLESLPYKSEGHGFDSRWCHWTFSLTQSFRPHCGPRVDSVSNRNEYQEYFLGSKGGRCVELTTLPPSYANCLEIWEPQPPETLKACPGL